MFQFTAHTQIFALTICQYYLNGAMHICTYFRATTSALVAIASNWNRTEQMATSNDRNGTCTSHLCINNNIARVIARAHKCRLLSLKCQSVVAPAHDTCSQNCWNAIRHVLQCKQFLNIIVYDWYGRARWEFNPVPCMHVEWQLNENFG